MKIKTEKKLNKALNIVANAFVYVFCALCLLLLLFTVFSKRDEDGAVKLFGYEMRVVLSGSMEKHEGAQLSDYKIKDIKTGSMVFVQLVPNDVAKAEEWYAGIKVGDVLTFRYLVAMRQQTITHRVIDIQPKTGGYLITLRGDNSSDGGVQVIDTSDEASPNYVIGKVTGKNYLFGWFAYSLKRPMGLAMLIIIPCTIITIWQVVRIVNLIKLKKEK